MGEKCPSVGNIHGGDLTQPRKIKDCFLQEEAPELRPEDGEELARLEK
jgi:hypothetical protein